MNKAIDIDKLRAVVLYVISKYPAREVDFHLLFKIMYFADMEHLAVYGRSVIIEDYSAITYGPVPSYFFDVLKKMRNHSFEAEVEPFIKALKVKNEIIIALQAPDMEELSNSDIDCLDFAIEKLRTTNFDERTELSHGLAYIIAWNKTKNNSYPISKYDMAREGGASEELIEEMKEIDILCSKLA